MIRPGVYDIRLQRRADCPVSLVFKDSNDSPINLTGWTVVAQIWNNGRTVKYGDFTVEYVSRVNGQVKLTLGYQTTATLPDVAEYDVLLINGSGLREYYLEGKIYASEGYTATP